MSTEPQDFEKLQRLMKLARHETPPPGYFNNFSSKVINRIEAQGSAADSAWSEASWFRKVMMVLERNALAAGVFGVSVCGLLISGINYSQNLSSGAEYLAAMPSGNLLAATDNHAEAIPASWTKGSGLNVNASSVSPMFTTNVPGSLFGMSDVQRVSFSLGQ